MKKERKFIKNNIVRLIAANGIIAALYVVLTLVTYPLSYSYMQVRLSEFLMLLVFFNPYYSIGLTLGCLIANIFSSVGPIDIGLGTAATLISCLLMAVCSLFIKSLFFNATIPCLVNAIMIPFVIYLSSGGTIVLTAGLYFTMFGWILLGEAISILVVGYPLFMVILKRYPSFHRVILSTRNQSFKF